jgi:hypothetical protein
VAALTCRPEIAELLPEALAREAGVFPIDLSEDTFVLAAAGPLSDEVCDTLRFVLGREIRIVVKPDEAIRKALDDCYGADNAVEVSLFYSRKSARILDTGAVEISVSGWESGQGRSTHWTGWESFTPDDCDYALWAWVLTQGDRFPDIIGPEKLEEVRRDFHQDA